jgi:hypothetical protein
MTDAALLASCARAELEVFSFFLSNSAAIESVRPRAAGRKPILLTNEECIVTQSLQNRDQRRIVENPKVKNAS